MNDVIVMKNRARRNSVSIFETMDTQQGSTFARCHLGNLLA